MSAGETHTRVLLHALPVLNVAEHLSRTRLQSGAVQAYGALLGTVARTQVEVHSSFETVLRAGDLDGAAGALDDDVFTARRDQYKQVFPEWEVIGWYAIGSAPDAHLEALHRQMHTYAEAPVLLLLDPRRSTFATVQDAGELPLQTYESSDGEKLVRCEYELETSDAERIALGDANRKAVPAGAAGAAETRGDARSNDPVLQADDEEHSRVLTALLAERSAVHMLHDRLGTACRYLERVRAGELPRDHETLRTLAAAVANQGAAHPREFEQLLDEHRDDALLKAYLAAATSATHSVDELADLAAIAAPAARSTRPGMLARR